MENTDTPIQIDIVSDVVCPWCYIGQARLKQALGQVPADKVKVSWKPFQLRPDMPLGGRDSKAFMKEKFGDAADAMIARVEEHAHQEQLPMDFSKVEKAPNTLEAHRLMWLAQQEGKDDQLAYLLFQAYFAEGKDVEGTSSLLNIGREAGLSDTALQKFEHSKEGLKEVQQEEYQYRNAGVTAVPSFIVNNKYLVQGAQPAEAFLELFERLSPQLTPAMKNGGSCNDDNCEF